MLSPGVSIYPADGDFELEADGIGVGGNVGLLYEFNPQTRIGVVYRSEVKVEDEGTPEFSGLSDARKTLLKQSGVLNRDITMDTNIPQSLMAGIFHDFGNGWTMSADALWLDFSNFSIDNITIGNTRISKEGTDYKDIWSGSLGAAYAVRDDWSLRAGVLYVSSGMDDEDRTIFSRYDAFWGVGAGVEHEFKSKRTAAVDNVEEPTIGADFDRKTGLGDIVLWTAFSKQYKPPFVWGVGPTIMMDTATDDQLGTGKWSAGPMALAFNITEKWIIGGVFQHWWSFGGEDTLSVDTSLGRVTVDRPDVNLTDFQYVIRYRLSPVTNIGAAPNIRYNWETDQLNLPIGIGFDTLVKLGPLPVKVGLNFITMSRSQTISGLIICCESISFRFSQPHPGQGLLCSEKISGMGGRWG